MPTDSKSEQPQIGEGAFKNIILLTLPFLSFQLQILNIAKQCIENAGNGPSEKFIMSEVRALIMILDRSRTWRDLFDQDFEEKAENLYKKVFPKFASASVQLIEAQEEILTSTFDALNTLRKGAKANTRSK
jgi:hypothetical protein